LEEPEEETGLPGFVTTLDFRFPRETKRAIWSIKELEDDVFMELKDEIKQIL